VKILKHRRSAPHRSHMRAYAIVLIALFCSLVFGDEALLSPRFRTVYVVSMNNALDQHLATRLTSGRVLWVVLDPASADAVLTDNVDQTFWNWLEHTYPGPSGAPASPSGASGNNPGGPYHVSNLSAPTYRGTIFLVDPRRRLVLWSTYELPKNSSPSELDRSATRITNQLKTAFGRN
jgi:hypothetical protein